ncbi:M48 family metallopeptidase [Lentzea sp. CC55]|uniref:M48 family metallopeptidase n=1 Tax=Lentzea sp. CC55 TaxID=2884909 RepID=UPI001F340F02|nr:M48 family metallopeptidase [Lentzea sp. CC55]MCG8928475.1 M48 family metallopeptidase [Lentzea sp. CC55]
MTGDIEQSSRVRFPGISSRAYEHPADRGALAVLRAVPAVGPVIKAVAAAFSERGERLVQVASSVRVGPKQFPDLHRLQNEVAAAFDLQEVPELFVRHSPLVNAQTRGIDKPFIVLNSALVERFDREQLRWVVGHEMGHAMSGHGLYNTILDRLLGLRYTMGWNPAGTFAMRAVIAALYEWQRKTELSCDRAGLLAGQDPQAALRVHLAFAGDTGDQVDIASFLEQAKEYEGEDIRDSILKLLDNEQRSHPLAVVRAAELQRWAASEEYREILTGTYPRREDDHPTNNLTDDIKGAARSYKESMSSSADPLIKTINDIGETVMGAAGKMWSKVAPNGAAE